MSLRRQEKEERRERANQFDSDMVHFLLSPSLSMLPVRTHIFVYSAILDGCKLRVRVCTPLICFRWLIRLVGRSKSKHNDI